MKSLNDRLPAALHYAGVALLLIGYSASLAGLV